LFGRRRRWMKMRTTSTTAPRHRRIEKATRSRSANHGCRTCFHPCVYAYYYYYYYYACCFVAVLTTIDLVGHGFCFALCRHLKSRPCRQTTPSESRLIHPCLGSCFYFYDDGDSCGDDCSWSGRWTKSRHSPCCRRFRHRTWRLTSRRRMSLCRFSFLPSCCPFGYNEDWTMSYYDLRLLKWSWIF
jgi:hypothetical protein